MGITSVMTFRSLLASIAPLNAMFGAGLIEGQSSVLLPQLRQANSFSSFQMTEEEGSWVASLVLLTSSVFALISGVALDFWGRKIILLLYFIIATAGFFLEFIAVSLSWIYVGRFLLGIALGISANTIIYLPEVCTTSQKSVFFSLISPAFALGVAVTYAIGGYLPWRTSALILTLLSFIGLSHCLFIPESPAWLLRMNRSAEAVRSFKWLGRVESEITDEILIIKPTVKPTGRQYSILNFLQPSVWKPFLILLVFHFLIVSTGIYNLMYYTVDILSETKTFLNPVNMTIILSVLRLFSTFTVVFYLLTKVPRKKATLISNFSISFCLVIIAACKYSTTKYPDAQSVLSYVSLICFMFYIILSNHVLPWIMTGELFPLSVRGVMVSATFFFANMMVFLFIKLQVFFKDYLDISGVFLLFGIGAFLAGLFAVFILPETLGKSFLEIEQEFLTSSRQNKREEIVL